MQVTTKLSVDLTRPNTGARVNAVQGDGNTRCVEITLLSGGESWEPPEGVEAAIAYYQPNGHKGLYDKLADDADAVSISGDVATITIAPQMLSASGIVQAALVFNDAQLNRLTTFPFSVSVARNPAIGAQETEDYIRLKWLEDKLREQIGDIARKTADILQPEIAQLQDNTIFLNGAVITATGDSITAQERNFAKLIAEEFGMTYENVAQCGAVVASGILTDTGGHRPCICDTIASMRQDADIILLSGGVNDQVGLNHSLEFLGELTVGFDQTLNKATLYGALEYMLRQAVYKWSNKTILYVLPHRMTMDLDYRTAVLRACEKYGVPVVDIMESTMDFYTLQEFKELYTSNGDGWHPNEEGFRTLYVPQILDAVRKNFRGLGETVSIDDVNMPEVICVNSASSASETFSPDIPGFIRSTNGSVSTSVNYLRTDYLPLAGKVSMEYNVFISGGSDSNHSTWALFDESKVWLASSDDCTKEDFWHTVSNGVKMPVGFKHNEIPLSELLSAYPDAAYVVFSTYVYPEFETLFDEAGANFGWGTQEACIILKSAEEPEKPAPCPVECTEDMTLPVGMDEQGRLFAKKDSDVTQLKEDLSDLAPAGAAIGQIFRVAAISEDGKYTMEPVDMPTGTTITEDDVSGWGFTKNAGTYSKPEGGIPASDLADGVIPDVTGKLDKPQTAPEVGKILKVMAVNDDGTFSCEWADAPSGGGAVDDVTVDGVSIVQDGVANIPIAGPGVPGVASTSTAYGLIMTGKSVSLYNTPTDRIDRRFKSPNAITTTNFDYAVKAAMCDGQGAAWTDVERLAALLRIGCTVDDSGIVHWTAQEVEE